MTVMAGETATGTAARARARPRPAASRPIRANVTSAPSRGSQRLSRARSQVSFAPQHRGNYQAVILAEFVAAIVLTAATPITTNRQHQTSSGLSPFYAADVAQLAALTVVYLVLALISTGSSSAGRVAAWFGGLILLGVGLGEASTIAKTLNIFGSPAGASGPDVFGRGTAGPLTGPAGGTGVGEGSAGPLTGTAGG